MTDLRSLSDQEPKYVIEYGKLALLALVIFGGFALVIVAIVAMEPDDSRFAPILALGSAQIAGAVGYLTGNGRLAAKGEPNVPAIGVTPMRAAARALELSELARVPTEELIREAEHLRASEQTGAVLHGLASITLELERRNA